VIYRDQPRDLVIDFELPPHEVVPLERSFKYVQTRDKIEAQARPLKEIRPTYADLIAQVALRTLHEVFSVPDAEEIVAEATLTSANWPASWPTSGPPRALSSPLRG
jgi:restriction system protein